MLFSQLQPRGQTIAVFAICFVLQLTIAVAITIITDVMVKADFYSDIAVNLLNGHGFVGEQGGDPILWRAPLYPAFLAMVFGLWGEENAAAVLIAQTFLSATTATLVWWIGRRLYSNAVGWLAAVGFAVYPFSAYYTVRFMPEALFTLVLTGTMATLLWAVHSGKAVHFAGVGALVALAALIKPVALGFAPFLVLYLLYRGREEPRRAVFQSAVLMVSFVMVVMPWTLRNYAITGTVIPVATGVGYSLWSGNQTISDGRDEREMDEATLQRMAERRRTILATHLGQSIEQVENDLPLPLTYRDIVNITPEEDRALLWAGLSEMVSHPVSTLILWGKKFYRYWFDIFWPQNRWAQGYIIAMQSVFLGVACIGWWRVRKEKLPVWPVLLPMAYFTAIYVITSATLRYSVPIAPLLMLFAGVGLCDLYGRSLGKKKPFGIGAVDLQTTLVFPAAGPSALKRN
ncbi:MAG: glycosyltransferase family 39 protein [Nitrospira sp.]|nr:glycosyltransferase family 39 protein [Nitrospira sp.]